MTFYEAVTRAELFQRETTFDVDFSNSQPPDAFPEKTFKCLQDIILGEGAPRVDTDDYRSLFGVVERLVRWTEIPDGVARAFSISSKRQRFLALAMMNQPDTSKARSKNVLIRDALHRAGLPASADEMRKLKGVYSQLKSKDVLAYAGSGDKKTLLTMAFRQGMIDALKSAPGHKETES